MCGIAGALAPPHDPAAPDVVRAIVASQLRRGPDFQAVEAVPGEAACVVLGHDRLSIIDLSAASHQPLWDVSGRYALVYNGEVYNYLELREELRQAGHSFATDSDSEVILEAFKAWGEACLHRLNGMFAFGLLDRETQALWLVRDRFGVKPLYYHFDGKTLYFASTGGEIARRLGLPPDPAYVARGLRYWVYEDDGDLAPYVGLKALPAGMGLHAAPGPDGPVLRLERWYDLAARVRPLVEALATEPAATLVARVVELLEGSIDLRLRADVPVGVSLSGGLDSSAITALLARRHPDVRGFTYGRPDERASEGPLVAKLAAATGVKVEYVWPTPAEATAALWETLAAQDAPFPTGSIVAQNLVFKAARAAGVRVLLGGQGGDEVFMGYRKFMAMRLRRLLREGRHAEALGFAASLVPAAIAELPLAGQYLRARHRYQVGPVAGGALRLPEAAPLELGFQAGRPGWERQLLDITRFSLPTLLRYEDRNSMGNSVESRLPFLDYRLVELGLALPEAVKLRGGYGKWVLREATRGVVPDPIRLARYKRGFDVAFQAWLDGGMGQAIRDRLAARPAAVAPWLAPGVAIETAFSDRALRERPAAFAEAVSLAWLAERGGA